MTIGVESWKATCSPEVPFVVPGARVTRQMPGRPVSLPYASAIIEAAPSWRAETKRIAPCVPWSASSTAR